MSEEELKLNLRFIQFNECKRERARRVDALYPLMCKKEERLMKNLPKINANWQISDSIPFWPSPIGYPVAPPICLEMLVLFPSD